MTESKKKNSSCNGKSKIMLSYGLLQLSANLISAISLAVIAISLVSIKNDANLFKSALRETSETFNSISDSDSYSNGSNRSLILKWFY